MGEFNCTGLLGLDYQPLSMLGRRRTHIRYEKAPEIERSNTKYKNPLYQRSKGSTLCKKRGGKFFFLKFNPLEVQPFENVKIYKEMYGNPDAVRHGVRMP